MEAKRTTATRGMAAVLAVWSASASAAPPIFDMHFVDASRGWAVGAHGLMLQTSDGGAVWKLHNSRDHRDLYAVFFLDESRGWIAGGSSRPYSDDVDGFLLRTVDGGETWTRSAGVPLIQQLVMWDLRQGAALVVPSPGWPSGIAFTADGGQTWTSPALPTATSAAALHSLGPRRLGAFSRAADPLLFAGPAINVFPAPSPSAVAAIASARAAMWAVGDGGLMLASADGRNWTPPAASPPVQDWSHVAAYQRHLWLAARNGDDLWISHDHGASWRSSATGLHGSVTNLKFVDERRGWISSDYGEIAATSDGGGSWQIQRPAQSPRCDVLVIAATPRDIPWEAIIQLAELEGQTCELHVIAASEEGGAASVAAAMRFAGGQSATISRRFPLPYDPTPLRDPLRLADSAPCDLESAWRSWEAQHASLASTVMMRELVARIRAARPETILVSAPLDQPTGRKLQALSITAVEAAGDSQRVVEAGGATTPAWVTNNVFLARSGNAAGGLSIAVGRLVPTRGTTLEELAESAASLVEPLPRTRSSWSFTAAKQETAAQGHLTTQVRPPRELIGAVADGDPLAASRDAATRRRRWEALLAAAVADQPSNPAAVSRAMQLAEAESRGAGGRLAYWAAAELARQGMHEVAANVLLDLVAASPADAYSAPALRWLARYYGSRELTFHRRLREATLPPADADDVSPAAVWGNQSEGLGGEQSRLLQLFAAVQKSRPELMETPVVALARADLIANAGRPEEAAGLMTDFISRRPRDLFSAAASRRVARWRRAPDPAATTLRRIDEPPFLDARLDDETWKSAATIPLASRTQTDAPAVLRAAIDDEYLYFAFQIDGGPGVEPAPRPRRPDDRLAGRRVVLSLDLDDEPSVVYDLAVDEAGRTREACGGDELWNPRWYVAERSDADEWTWEAAAELATLTDRMPGPGEAWRLRVQLLDDASPSDGSISLAATTDWIGFRFE